jgi:hypothetical protein
LNKKKVNVLIAKYETDEDTGDSKWTYNSNLEKPKFVDFDSWLEKNKLKEHDDQRFFMKSKGNVDYYIFVGNSMCNGDDDVKELFSKYIRNYINSLKLKFIIFLHIGSFEKETIKESNFVDGVYLFQGPKGKIIGCGSEKLTVSKILACISGQIDPLKEEDFILYEPIFKKSTRSIISLFMSFDLDIKGIGEILSDDERKQNAKKYLKEVLSGNNQYSKKLKTLQKMITGPLDDGIPFEKIVSKYPAEINKTALAKLKTLSGLESDKTICNFMNLLDEKSMGIDEISDADVLSIIKFFENQKQKWVIQSGENKIRIDSFNDWTCELFKTLEAFSFND